VYTTSNMSLIAWDLDTDPYDHTDLYNNWQAVDKHDHTPGKGAPLPLEAIPIIDQAHLGPCSVGSIQICDGAVITQKLATPAVKEANLYPSSVTETKIAANAVATVHLQSGSVTTIKLANLSVTSDKIADAAVTNPKIANSAVNGAKIASRAVSNAHVETDSIDNRVLANNSVDSGILQDQSVIGPKIVNNQLGWYHDYQKPCVYLGLTSANTRAPDVWNGIDWDYARYNDWDMWNNAWLEIQVPGIYVVEAGILWEDGTGGGAGGVRSSRLTLNGFSVDGSGPHETFASQGRFRVRQSLSTTLRVNANDKFTVELLTTANNSQILPDGLSTHMSAVWVAP
jgi:hypothetical protein